MRIVFPGPVKTRSRSPHVTLTLTSTFTFALTLTLIATFTCHQGQAAHAGDGEGKEGPPQQNAPSSPSELLPQSALSPQLRQFLLKRKRNDETGMAPTFAGRGRRLRTKRRTPCSKHSDGCSLPDSVKSGIDPNILKALTPACDRHDVCYGCGRTFFVERQDCDSEFLDEMLRLCKKLQPSQVTSANNNNRTLGERKELCRGTARTFYLGVTFFGNLYYAKPGSTPAWCPQVRHCVSSKTSWLGWLG